MGNGNPRRTGLKKQAAFRGSKKPSPAASRRTDKRTPVVSSGSQKLAPLSRPASRTKPRPGKIATRLGLRVAQLRRSRGWAQVDLVAESGLDRSYISKIENGRKDISISLLEILANTFGMTVSQFMRGV